MNFAKFLKAPFSRSTYERLLLILFTAIAVLVVKVFYSYIPDVHLCLNYLLKQQSIFVCVNIIIHPTSLSLSFFSSTCGPKFHYLLKKQCQLSYTFSRLKLCFFVERCFSNSSITFFSNSDF